MTKITLRFSECEHGGDLARYSDDVIKAGGSIISEDVDLDNEQGVIIVEVEDKAAFVAAFKKTDAADFVWPPIS